jgi:hypothetical protein
MFHRLVTPGQSYSITPMMQDLGRQYVRYVNWVTVRHNVTILIENYFACLWIIGKSMPFVKP